MVVAQQDGQPLEADRLVRQPRPYRRIEPCHPAEGDIEPPGQDLRRRARQPAQIARHELDPGRLAAGQPEQPVARPHRGADVDQQRARLDRPGRAEVVVGGDHPAGVRQQPFAVGREGDLPGGPYEQFRTEFALQPPDVAAECLLGDVEPGGGAGEVQLLGDGDEGAQQPGIGIGGGHGPELTTDMREWVRSRCWTAPAGRREG